jgi:hypothetical protein
MPRTLVPRRVAPLFLASKRFLAFGGARLPWQAKEMAPT